MIVLYLELSSNPWAGAVANTTPQGIYVVLLESVLKNTDKFACIGGFFRARLSFPPEYPHRPPKMKFESPIFHPNSMWFLLHDLS
jgi:ubiquitin-protein ligase